MSAAIAAAQSRIRVWREQPGKFVRDVFGATPDAWQDEVLDAYAKHQRVCLKASKGPGKSTVMAWIGWHFLMTRLHPKVVCTSISGDNLRDGLWTEFAKWQHTSDLLKAAFTWTAERITAKDHPKTWWAAARQWSKTADAGQQSDTLAGIHADNVLFLVDEAGGIPDAVVAAAEAGLANAGEGREAKIILSGNPTLLSGPLYRACTTERRLWWVKEISGDPDDPKRAPRVSIQWAREQIEKYGRDNPWVLVNVFGQFPPGQSNALLGVEEVALASRRQLDEAAFVHEARILGVDVARQGDDRTVIFARQGLMALPPRVLRLRDLMVVASSVVRAIERFKPHAVFIDEGGLGAGVVDRVRQLKHPCTGVQFGGASGRTDPRCKNKRAEMWWQMAEWVKRGGVIPDNNELRGELVAPTYWHDAQDRVCLESKDEMKARGLPSPDLADALALTFADTVGAPPVWEQHRDAMGVPIEGGPLLDSEQQPYAQVAASNGSDWNPYADGRA